VGWDSRSGGGREERAQGQVFKAKLETRKRYFDQGIKRGHEPWRKVIVLRDKKIITGIRASNAVVLKNRETVPYKCCVVKKKLKLVNSYKVLKKGSCANT